MITIGNQIGNYNNDLFLGDTGGGDPPDVPQNFLLRSEEFDNASWTKLGSASIIANSILAPDGTLTADTLDASTLRYGTIVRQSTTFFTGIEYTLSVHLKKNNHSYVGLRMSQNGLNGTLYPFINLDTLATNTQGISGMTMGTESLADGWVRVWVTWVSVGTGFQLNDIGMTDSTGDAGDGPFRPAGTELVYIWGAQVNEGPIRDYAKTEGSIIP